MARAGGSVTNATTPILHSVRTLQNVNTPDIDLEQDVLEPEIEAEIALGMEATEISSDKFRVNISTILISALIFLVILAWFDFIQTAFYLWLIPQAQTDLIPASVKLWYAILKTVIIFILIILIYYHSRYSIM
jgi:hypothetical protein